MQFLVTGGAGRLGRSVVEHLLAIGHVVTVADIVAPAAPPCRHVTADLTVAGEVFDIIGATKPDVIVHLAGHSAPFSRPEHVIFGVNARLVFDVCQAAALTGVRSVICASSPTVIGYGNPQGWSPASLPIDEVHPVAPWHAYGMSKMVIETVVRGFAVQSDGHCRFFAMRPCYVVAPEEWRDDVVTQQGHTMRQRLEDPALAAPSLFNYVDARDAAIFVGALSQRSEDVPNGEVFFVGAEDAFTDRPVTEVLRRFHPATVPLLGTLDATQSVFDSGKARRLLGWRPERSWRTELQ